MKKRTVCMLAGILVLLSALLLAFTACGQVSSGEDASTAAQDACESGTEDEEENGAELAESAENAPQAPSGDSQERTPVVATQTPVPEATPKPTVSERDTAPRRTTAPVVTAVPTAPESDTVPRETAASVATTEPLHVHSWQPVYLTVHHDAVTEEVWVVDRGAYDQPIYAPMVRCRCGAMFESFAAYQDHARSYFDTSEESNHSSHNAGDFVVGYEHYDEIGHWETRTIQPAYDEQAIDHYTCSCGEIKEA